MLIDVVYNDNKHDMVDPFLLDELITSGKIIKFLRSEGWATIGSDPIRGTGGLYKGPERRNYSLLKLLTVEEKTKEQLNNELIELRRRITELEASVIEVGCKVKENENIYYIRDNGIGFDSQDTENIFTPFSRLPDARDFEGTGVGLSIVERIIKRHGGKVRAEGKINQGATFYFSLPHISNSNH